MKGFVNYYNVNGITTSEEIEAKSVKGLKSIATQNATGSHTKITLTCDDGFFVKESIDTFNGFCLGSKSWANA